LTFILSILGAIAFVFALILNYTEVRKKIKELMNQLRKGFGDRRQMFRERRWWKQYHPSCEIASVGKLEINRINGKYDMRLEIDVKYTSNDNLHPTRIDIATVLLNVASIGKDRDKVCYRLYCSNFVWRVAPATNEGGYRHVPNVWDLPSKESWVIRYTFIGEEAVSPLLDDSASCKMVAIGKAKIERVPSRQLKAGHKFAVEVVKKYEK